METLMEFYWFDEAVIVLSSNPFGTDACLALEFQHS